MENKIKSSEAVSKFRKKRAESGWKVGKIELALHPKIQHCQFILATKKDFLKFISKLAIRIATEKAYDPYRFHLLFTDRVLSNKSVDYLSENKSDLLKEFAELRGAKLEEALNLDFVEFVRSKKPELFSGDTEANINQLSKLISVSIAKADEIQTLAVYGKGAKVSELFGRFYETIGRMDYNKGFVGACHDFVFEQMCAASVEESNELEGE